MACLETGTISVDIFGPEIASLRADEGVPLGEEGDGYSSC